jgi:N-acetylglucosaminyl-diphospho-decaprenol L-rhamnosyltransferase
LQPDLSVVIVSYRCREALERCLASLVVGEPSGPADAPAAPRWGVSVETIVVDNDSGDGTAEMVRERFASVRLIANPANRGLAAAANQGIAIASGRHILMLNPDTVVREGALEGMVRILDGDAGIGACGPQLLNPDGSIQPSARRLPGFASLLHQYTPLRVLRVFRNTYRRYKMLDFDFQHVADVESLMGAAICVPRRIVDEIGGLDERFFVYYEEVDFCRRILESGRRLRFDPSCRVTHVGGVSADRTAAATVFYYRSLFKYLRKYHSRPAAFAMVWVLWLGMIVREAGLAATNLLAAGALAAVGRGKKANTRLKRARSSARLVCRDGWQALLKS